MPTRRVRHREWRFRGSRDASRVSFGTLNVLMGTLETSGYAPTSLASQALCARPTL